FLAQPHQGVNYAPGVWHHPLLALDAVSEFIVIDRAGPGHNCDEITLPQHGVIPARG
ncbi:ureidoglycolate lyase, partial [Thauera linaloolentis]